MPTAQISSRRRQPPVMPAACRTLSCGSKTDLQLITTAKWAIKRGANHAMKPKREKGNPKVDAFLSKAKQWQAEFKKLRTIVLGCRLTEELKWGKPCYSFQESNIVLIH